LSVQEVGNGTEKEMSSIEECKFGDCTSEAEVGSIFFFLAFACVSLYECLQIHRYITMRGSRENDNNLTFFIVGHSGLLF
jgi:hypothetical protein